MIGKEQGVKIQEVMADISQHNEHDWWNNYYLSMVPIKLCNQNPAAALYGSYESMLDVDMSCGACMASMWKKKALGHSCD